MSKQLFSSQNNFLKFFVIALIISLVLFIFYLLLKENVNQIEYQIYDSHIRIRNKIKGNEKVDYSIINIVINDKETDNTNIFNYRKKLTNLLVKLKEIKTKYVLIDIIFPENSDKETDRELIESIKGLSKVYLPFINNDEKNIFNFNELQQSLYGSGFNNIYLSEDGILRDLKLFDDNIVPSSFFVSFKMTCDSLGVNANNIIIGKNCIILKNAVLPSGINKDIKIPLTKNRRFLLNYTGIFNTSFFTYSAKEILDRPDLLNIANELNDSIIVISNIKLFNNNIVKTPFEKSLYSSFIHSYLINSIITQNFIYYVENTSIYLTLYILLLIFVSFLFYYYNIDKIIMGYAILIVFLIVSSFGLFILFNIYLNILIMAVPLTLIFIIFLVNKYYNEKINNFLFYMVTHDIKNELYSIKLNSKIIEKKINNKDVAVHISTIAESSDNLLTFIERISDILKLKRNKILIKKESLNLNALIRSVINNYQKAADEKKQKLNLTENGEEYLISADKERIVEIFDNLISNAIKYSKYDSLITVTIERKNRKVKVSVKDSGEGFDLFEKLRLFNEFSQIKTMPTGNEKKVGLGLYITKELVKLNKGSIMASSKKGKSSTFIVTFPLI